MADEKKPEGSEDAKEKFMRDLQKITTPKEPNPVNPKEPPSTSPRDQKRKETFDKIYGPGN